MDIEKNSVLFRSPVESAEDGSILLIADLRCIWEHTLSMDSGLSCCAGSRIL